MKKINNITPFKEDIAKWYSDLVLQSDLISYAPVKGTMFFKPQGFAIWNLIKNQLTELLIEVGVEEVIFPLLFPMSFLVKEKNHVEGFAPEVLVVTRVGEKEFNDPLVIRPTSETLFGTFFKENLSSYKQLPMKLNQWCSVIRWESNTRPFLRNSEFFWQEGHTMHATLEDTKDFTTIIIDLYENFLQDYLLLPVIKGEKTIGERFAGADHTFTVETILKDGQALQSGTSHNLGNNFAKAFDVKVLGVDNKMYYPFQTSWAVSTRLIGALIMTHSDDRGLVMPSKIAPQEVVIMTLFADKNPQILKEATKILKKLKGNRIKIDDSNKGIGYKAQEWETKGVPIRIELGPRDLEKEEVTIALRTEPKKFTISLEKLTSDYIQELLAKNDLNIWTNAKKLKDNRIQKATTLKKVKELILSGKVAEVYWNEDAKIEAELKEEYGATIRCIIKVKKEGKCIHSQLKTYNVAIIARAY